MTMMTLLRNGTRASMAVFAKLLAEDAQLLAEGSLQALALDVLDMLDRLDVGADEEVDRRVERVRYAPGEEWLVIAESGQMHREYVSHMLHFSTLAAVGAPGGPFVQALLRAIETGSDDERDTLALAAPEYVGLWRACAHVEGSQERLMAVLAR